MRHACAAPGGDPRLLRRWHEIALRHETADAIRVRPCTGVTAAATPAEETPNWLRLRDELL